MKTILLYGRNNLEINLPDSAQVLHSRFIPGLTDETATIRQSLRSPIASAPLSELIKPGDQVVVTHSDITRATPNNLILPVLLNELEAAGVLRRDITLLNALGTHRPQTETELRAMLGDQIVDNYRCVQHNAFLDENLASIGMTSLGHPVRINRLLLENNVRIFTGFIEPHLFAGFSGGPKSVLPALAGMESVLTNHGAAMIAHPRATWGVTYGNPIWEEMLEVAIMTQPTMLLNVTLNSNKEITGVFAGDLLAAHATGCDFTKRQSMVPVDAPFDVVITTNSGYPLDMNMYQSVKGLSAARQVVRPGGAIILVTACEEGLPEYGSYAKLLKTAGSPQAALDMILHPGFSQHDQWQVQIQALTQLHADVYVYSDGLTDEQMRESLLAPIRNLETGLPALLERYGPRLCVLPEGPLTIPYIS